MRPQLLLWSIVAVGGIAGAVSCSSASGGEDPLDPGTDGGADGLADGGFVLDGDKAEITSLVLDPATATLEVDAGVPAKATFKLLGKHADGSSEELVDGVSWSATEPAIGDIAPGAFTANGNLGGTVAIKATYKGKSASASLVVKLKVRFDDATLDDPSKDGLKKATTADGTIKWAYPYDDTVFPRGLTGPTLMWNNGLASDGYRISLESATFSYEGFTKVPTPSRWAFPEKTWQQFTESTSGGATLTVSRYAAGVSTVVTKLAWKVAPASMKGTIYYWSNREGRVLRIKPGAAAPDDFSAAVLPKSATLEDGPHDCTMTCHRVSADGSTLISGGDVFGGSYDLAKNAPRYSFAPATTTARRSWHFAGINPNGKYVVTHGNGTGGLYASADGSAIPGTGLEGIPTWYPTFAPTGKKLFFVDFAKPETTNSLFSFDFDEPTRKFSARKLLVSSGGVASLPAIAYPTGTPDGNWVVYQRASKNADTRGDCLPGKPACEYNNRADLYMASAVDSLPEIALAKLNGTGYPFAAGSRDAQWNFEPNFAPVAAGGYFWIVFTTRRSYGNAYDGVGPTDPTNVKQLWVAAIDTTITPGKDPSHAAFRLPGQALTYTGGNSLNMSGFWALEPCKSDGTTCSAGSDCCGGFCEKKAGAATGTCTPTKPACSADGDKCDKDDDCCNKGVGARCLGGFCAEKPPA
ncbi:MAG: hypothetical protein IPJ34_12490 [Myxococcales bacterium]|nr:hypothetical protein [Myxococcales bacterium]